MSEGDGLSVEAGKPEGPEHRHHWIIGLQNGPSSGAVCKGCGERRDFLNTLGRRTPAGNYPMPGAAGRTSSTPTRSAG